VEGGGGERGGLVALEEAGVGLDAGDFLPVQVKDLNEMGGRATVDGPLSQCTECVCEEGASRRARGKKTYTANTGRCSWVLAVRSTSLVVWNVFSG
jgi:hypothetical protein